jgi:hypothetical protein
MSKEALAALDAIAGDSAEGESPTQKAMRMLDERAQGKDFSAPETQQDPSYLSKYWKGLTDSYHKIEQAHTVPGVGALETVANMATGAVAPIPAALDSAIRGTPYTQAKNNFTYAPQSEAGQAMVEGAGALLRPVADAIGAGREQVQKLGVTKEQAEQFYDPTVDALLGVGTARAIGPEASPSAAIRQEAAQAAPESIQTGKSAGASAADVNVRQLSPELREVVTQAAKQGELNPESFQRHVEADQLPIPIRLSRGQATQDVRLLSEEQNARAKNPEFAARFQQQNKQLIENLDEVRRETAPTVVGNDHIQNGQTLVDAYKSMDETARADISAKYKALEEANGGEFPVNGQAFVKAADAALTKKMKGRYVPPEVSGDLAELREGGAMTFETFENLRTNLAAAARKAERSGDGNAASAINIVREHLENLPIEGEAANIKPLADAARSAAKARFDRIKSDPAYKAATEDAVGAGESSPLADNFVERYVVKGKGAHIKKMREHLAGDDVAQETIAAGALNYLKNKAGVDAYTNEGNFSQAGYNKALNELLPKMNDLVPGETAETLQRIGATARATQAQPRGSYVNNSNTFVSQLGNHAANVLEGMANVKAGGIPVGTFVRKKLGGRAEKKFVEESLKPGAGLALKEVLDPKAKKKK